MYQRKIFNEHLKKRVKIEKKLNETELAKKMMRSMMSNFSLIDLGVFESFTERDAIHYHLQVEANSKKIVQKNRCYF